MPNRKSVARMRPFRCPACQLRRSFCVCAELPRFALETRVCILMHYREERLATNTGRLVAAALPNSEVRVRGRQGLPMSSDDLEGPGALVLFPSERAEVLTTELARELRAQTGGPLTLIVPDGNWGQARRMIRREAALTRIRHVKLPDSPRLSNYVRRAPNDSALCTFESIARAIGILESRPAQDRLEAFFEIMVERVRFSRGMLTLEQCRHPIPEAARREAYEAGCRGGALSRQTPRSGA